MPILPLPPFPDPPEHLIPLREGPGQFLHETMGLRIPMAHGELGLYFLSLLFASPQYASLQRQYERVLELQKNGVDDPWEIYRNDLHRLKMILDEAPWGTLPQQVSAMAMKMGKLEKRKPTYPTQIRHSFSCDQKTANYQVYHFLMKGKVPPTWESFCNAHAVHPYLRECKKFRQHLFGLIEFNPAVQTTWQHIFTTKLLRRLEERGFKPLWILHDELGGILPPDIQIQQILGEDPEVEWRPRRLTDTPLEEGFRRHVEPMEPMDPPLRALAQIPWGSGGYWMLVGIPGSRFVPAFKTHILDQPLLAIDFLFRHEGRLALWVA